MKTKTGLIRRIRKIVAVCMCLLLTCGVLTSCSSNDSDESSGNTNTLRLGIFALPTHYLMQVFDDMGLYKQNGANVELVFFPGGADCIQAFTAGQLDMIAFAAPDAIPALVNGVDFKIISVYDKSYGLDGIAARSDIETVADLKGKTIASEIGTVDHFLLLKALEDAGLSEEDVTIMNMNSGDAAAAFSGGSIDAVSTWEPQLSQAARYGHIIYTTRENPDLIPDIFVAKTSALENDYDNVKAVIKTWFDGIGMYLQDKDTYCELGAEKGDMTKEEFASLMDTVSLTTYEDNLTAFTSGEGDYKYLDYLMGDVSTFLYNLKLIDTMPTQEQIDSMFDGRIITELSQEG